MSTEPPTKRTKYGSAADANSAIQARMAGDIAEALVEFGPSEITGYGLVNKAYLFMALFHITPFDSAVSLYSAFFAASSASPSSLRSASPALPASVSGHAASLPAASIAVMDVAAALIKLKTEIPEQQHAVSEALLATVTRIASVSSGPCASTESGFITLIELAINEGSATALSVMTEFMSNVSDTVARRALAVLIGAPSPERTGPLGALGPLGPLGPLGTGARALDASKLAYLVRVIGDRIDWSTADLDFVPSVGLTGLDGLPSVGPNGLTGLDGLDGLDALDAITEKERLDALPALLRVGAVRTKLLVALVCGNDTTTVVSDALFAAIAAGDNTTVSGILVSGFPGLRLMTSEGHTPATSAVSSGHIDTLARIVDALGAAVLYDPNSSGKSGLAMLLADPAAFDFIKDQAAICDDILTCTDPATGEDLAHMCVRFRRPEILALYCETLGRLQDDNKGRTPLSLIAAMSESDGAPLLEAIAAIAAPGIDALLTIAAEHNSAWFVRAFPWDTSLGTEPLYVAVSMLHEDFVRAYVSVFFAAGPTGQVQRKCVAAVYPCIATDACASMRILGLLGCTNMLLDHGTGLAGLSACVSDIAMREVLRHFQEIYAPDSTGSLLHELVRLGKSECVALALEGSSRSALAALKASSPVGETPMSIAAATHNLDVARSIHDFYSRHYTAVAGDLDRVITTALAIEGADETHVAALRGLRAQTLQFSSEWSNALLVALNCEPPATNVAAFLIETGAAAPLLDAPTLGLYPAFLNPTTLGALLSKHSLADLFKGLMLACPAQDLALCAAVSQATRQAMQVFMLECEHGFVQSPYIEDSAEKIGAFVQVGALLANTLVSRIPCAVEMGGYFSQRFLTSVIYTDEEPDEATKATRRGFESMVPPGFLTALRAVSLPRDIGLRINGVDLI